MKGFAICVLAGILLSAPATSRVHHATVMSYGNSITLEQAMHLIEGARSYTPKQVTDHQRRSLLAVFLFRFACLSSLPILLAGYERLLLMHGRD